MTQFKLQKHTLLLVPLLALSACGTSTSLPISEEPTSEGPTTPLTYEFDDSIAKMRGGAYYEIFVRSFADSDDDGIGDLRGVADKMSYLDDLGVGGVWLMPIHPSPSYHGYDVDNYKAIRSEYGTLADFEYMIEQAEENDIDVIIDLVLNHSSKNHPWFVEGLNNFKNGNYNPSDNNNKANWYNFKWQDSKVIYEAGFGDWMPDLNLDNPAVRAELASIAEFWLDLGVTGFRLDATSWLYRGNNSKSIQFLSWFKETVEAINPNAYIVGEAWEAESVVTDFYGGLDSFFNFAGANSGGYVIDLITSNIGSSLGNRIASTYTRTYEMNEDALVASFLTNHDMDRSSQMFIMNIAERQKLAASIYLLTPGVPFMYYGEEIGIKGTRLSAQTDANRRLPMIWQRGSDPWRTNVPPGTDYNMADQVRDGAFDLLEEPFSLVNHYKKVLNVRAHYPFLRTARVAQVTIPNNLLVALKYTSKDGLDKPIYVMHNVSGQAQEFSLTRLSDETDNLEIGQEIYTGLERVIRVDNTITLGAYSSVVIEER